MIQSLLKAANKQQQGQSGGRNSMHPGYTSGTTRNRRSPARSASWKDCFRREKVAGMNIFCAFKKHILKRLSKWTVIPEFKSGWYRGKKGRSFEC